MRGALISVLVLATACGGLRSQADGGAGGGAAGGSGGGSATGGGATGGGAAGGSTGGGSAGGSGGGSAGGSAGGGAPMNFRYATVAIPSTNGSYIVGISGRPGEVYAVSDSNGLFRATTGGFTELVGSMFSGTGKGIYVAPDGAVFPVSQRQLGSCMSNCSMPQSYTFQAVSLVDVFAVCGNASNNVYAVTEDTGYNGQLWHWNGSTWTSIVNNLGIKVPRACVMLADGSVAIAGTKSIAIHLNGITAVEDAALAPPLTVSEAASTQWYGLGLVGGKLWVAGYLRRLSLRTGVNAWTMTTFTGASSTSFVIGGPSENEIYAGGGYEGTTVLRKFNGTTWSEAPDLPTLNSVRSMYVAGPNEIFFGGGDTTGNPAVDKAFRP